MFVCGMAIVQKNIKELMMKQLHYDYDKNIVKEFEPNNYDNKMILRGIHYGINPYSDLSLDSDGKPVI